MKKLDTELKKILSLKLDTTEKEELSSKGYLVKNPSKMTLLAVALYEKAAKGDLSALKEIFSRLGGENRESGGVVLIDDIKNST